MGRKKKIQNITVNITNPEAIPQIEIKAAIKIAEMINEGRITPEQLMANAK